MEPEYSDWTDDADAMAAFQRLEAEGYCRVTVDGPREWRVYQSPEQRDRSLIDLGLRDGPMPYGPEWIASLDADREGAR
jgi:hypothetical protein